MGYLLVAAGGACGSVARFVIGRRISERAGTDLPLGTFAVNVSGAILLGIMSSLGLDRNLYLLFCDGFLGAYTTFSTFMYEGFNLFQDNQNLNAAVYILGSVVLGIIGFIAGIEIAGFIQII